MTQSVGVRLLAAIVTIAMFAAVVGAIVVLGPPAEQRLLRLDARRALDLENIAEAVTLYAGEHAALPADLAALAKEPFAHFSRFDPETQAPYEYTVSATDAYILCAIFHASAPTYATQTRLDDQGWNHGAGRQCFDRKQKLRKE